MMKNLKYYLETLNNNELEFIDCRWLNENSFRRISDIKEFAKECNPNIQPLK